MGYLRVNRVIYTGQKYYFKSEKFDKNIIVIEGDNGTGKSTLCNLIYFALGGEVPSFRRDSDKKHVEITTDRDNKIDLLVTISKSNYILRRFIGDNDITIIPYVEQDPNIDVIDTIEDQENNIEVFPINRSVNNKVIFSDWLLSKLNISVVELFHGYSNFKINFTNLMRLIYHDQQPDPEEIYKRLDNNSALIADSETLRKAIFELLVGKSYSEFYDAIVDEKILIKEKALAKSLVNEYTSIANKLRQDEELKNMNFLKVEIKNKEEQLEKLHSARKAFKRSRSNKDTISPEIETLKNELIKNEFIIANDKEKRINLLDERFKLSNIKNETMQEIQQIKKVIFSHDQLNLFTAETCPYCLSKVDRIANHCVCGASIEEEQYERFFYTSQEYKDILKSKIKTLKTISLAYESCDGDVLAAKETINKHENNNLIIRGKLKKYLEKIDEPIDIESLNDIDDKILNVREGIGILNQLLDIELKLKKLQDEFDHASDKVTAAELDRKKHEIAAQQDITSQVHTFSKIYNKLVTDTLSDCRSAKIKLSNYLPTINDGEYKEASSRVSIRLMYFLTLMHMALIDEKVAFPKFLLIDTPETAGIELENLIKCIQKFEELDEYEQDYQVILATGLNKYPDSLAGNRVLFMPNKNKENRLLKEI